MTYAELARSYFPDSPPHAAVRRLTRWIGGDRTLQDRLRKAGFKPRQRTLTPRQLQVFRTLWGEP